jgi:hypothetical protein
MGRLGRKFKAGTGINKRTRTTRFDQLYGNVAGTEVPTDGITVPDGDIVTHPSSTNVIQIPKAPVIPTSAQTLPTGRRALSSSEKTVKVVVSIQTLNKLGLLIGTNSTVSCSSHN